MIDSKKENDMNDQCECQYCKAKVKEYFCCRCFFNFNRCESKGQYDGGYLCPKCHPNGLGYTNPECKRKII